MKAKKITTEDNKSDDALFNVLILLYIFCKYITEGNLGTLLLQNIFSLSSSIKINQ